MSSEMSGPFEVTDELYSEFYRIANRLVSSCRFENSLHATHLLNEAFINLIKSNIFERPVTRGYIFAAATKAMRQVILDYIKRKRAKKRLPTGKRVYLEKLIDQLESSRYPFEDLHEAIQLLEAENPEYAQIVNMRYFLGMTVAETANVLSVSTSTVEKRWSKARLWLYAKLNSEF